MIKVQIVFYSGSGHPYRRAVAEGVRDRALGVPRRACSNSPSSSPTRYSNPMAQRRHGLVLHTSRWSPRMDGLMPTPSFLAPARASGT